MAYRTPAFAALNGQGCQDTDAQAAISSRAKPR